MAQESNNPIWASSWVTNVTPSLMRRRRRAAGPQQEVPRPPPGVATGQGCPSHLHQLEDVVRLPILGHFRGYAVRGGGRVHIAVQRVRSLVTAVARASRHQRAPLPLRHQHASRPPTGEAGAWPGRPLLLRRARPPGASASLPWPCPRPSARPQRGTSSLLQLWPSEVRGVP